MIMKLKNILYLVLIFILCAISVSAVPFESDVYEVGTSWVTFNWTDIDLTNITPISTHYAEGYFHSYADPANIEIPTSNVYVKIMNFTMDEIYGFVSTIEGIDTTKAGTYSLTFSLAMQGGNGGNYEIELFINNASQPDCATFITTSVVAHQAAVVSCLKTLAVGDMLDVRVKDISSPAKNIQYHQLNFKIIETSTIPSETTCEISEDSSTWINITTILYNGYLDETAGIGNVLQLKEDTEYILRCKNSTTEWNENSFITEGGYNKMLALYIAIVVFAFAFLILGRYTENDFFFGLLSATLFLISGFMIMTTGIEGVDSVYTAGLGLLGIAIASFYYLEVAKNRKTHEG